MKQLPLIAATLSLCGLASVPASAQQTTIDSNSITTSSTSSSVTSTPNYAASYDSLSMDKPSTMVDPSTGGTIYVIPPHATGSEKDRADWIFHNLDDEQVRMYISQGYRKYEIVGAANLAMRTSLPMQFFLDQVRITGAPLWSLANEYGVSVRYLYRDIPGFGAEAIAYAPAELYANPNAPIVASNYSNYNYSSSTATAASSALPPATVSQGDLIAVISGDPRFTTFASAIRSAGLTANLQMPGPFTLFAPTNDAFAKLPAGTLDSLMQPQNQAQLRAVLLYHLVSGKMMSADLSAMTAPGTPKTLEGDSITITNIAPFTVNSANIVATDIPASNGVIDAIDSVLLPPSFTATVNPSVPNSAPAAPSASAPAVPATPAPAAPSTTPGAAPDTTTPSANPPAPAPGSGSLTPGTTPSQSNP